MRWLLFVGTEWDSGLIVNFLHWGSLLLIDLEGRVIWIFGFWSLRFFVGLIWFIAGWVVLDRHIIKRVNELIHYQLLLVLSLLYFFTWLLLLRLNVNEGLCSVGSLLTLKQLGRVLLSNHHFVSHFGRRIRHRVRILLILVGLGL